MRSFNLPIRRVIRGTDWTRSAQTPPNQPVSSSIEDLLAKPTWSVRSLLPPSPASTPPPPPNSADQSTPSTSTSTATSTSSTSDTITPSQLHHLLRLSALPPPKSPSEEAKMLSTLRSQIHFVRAVQAVDTRGVEPLITIRDETDEAIQEETITLETMQPYLALEEAVGRNGTVRRRDVPRTEEEDRAERATWEVDLDRLGVGSRERRRGRWFYVRRKKAVQSEKEREGGEQVVTDPEEPVT